MRICQTERMILLGVLVALVSAGALGVQAAPADLILTGGKIITLDESQSQAEALAIQGDRILAIGAQREIVQRWAGPDTQVIDLKGRLTLPGFIDGHGHFLGIGDALMILDLSGGPNWEALVQQVAEACAAAQPGVWIRARGWHQDKWDQAPPSAVEGLPVHRRLSELTPDNPVFLTHASGHASFVNARALELAGIDGATPNPSGAEILRDED